MIKIEKFITKMIDTVNLSIRKDYVIKKCNENGVQGIGEIKIGYDGIVLANSVI